MADRKTLDIAKKGKNDEFYTMYNDIQKELSNYKEVLKGKIIYCNCDSKDSNFYKYFKDNFNELQLKELLISGISGIGIKYNGIDEIEFQLESGKFQDNLKALEYCDIVVTNPPFSQFREFIDLLVEYDKDFIVWGSTNSITYKNVFPLIVENKINFGKIRNQGCKFMLPEHYEGEIGKVAVTTFTTFDVINIPFLKLKEKYEEGKYITYDNIDNVIESTAVKIPYDYDGIISVPISFISRWNKKQFELIGEANHGSDNKYDLFKPVVNGKEKFKRLLIKKK